VKKKRVFETKRMQVVWKKAGQGLGLSSSLRRIEKPM